MRLPLASLLAVLLLAGSVSAAAPDYKKLHALKGEAQVDAALKAPFLADLEAFVKKEHSDENVEFILAASAAKADKKAIYEKYIASSGPRTINLPSNLKKDLDTLAAAKGFAKMNFAAAIHEIKKLIERDTMPRFMSAHPLAAAPALKPADVAAIAAFKAQAEKAKTRAETVIGKGAAAISKDKGARDSLATGLKGELSKAKEAKLKIKDAAAKADDSYKAADKILTEAIAKVDEAVKMIPKGGQ
jgi:hypothetical protein